MRRTAQARTNRLNAFVPSSGERAAPLPANGCRVTIGMPVYNGELYVERAIRSILMQTYKDFRLLIVDNASTDRTAEIAQYFARLDSRVVYRRNAQNIGAHPNYNLVFALADTEYFKWAAHDDEIKPTYLEACVRALDADLSAVLAQTFVEEFDGKGNVRRTYQPMPDETSSPRRLTRFRCRVLWRGSCTEVFGLIRAEKLRGTRLMGGFAASDLSLITELTLRGRFAILPEPLFRNRIDPERYTAAVFENDVDGARRTSILAWCDTSKPIRWWSHLHWWIFFLAYFPMINRNVGPWHERLRYYLVASRWVTVRNHRKDLAKDLLFLISPMLLERAVRIRRRLLGSESLRNGAEVGTIGVTGPPGDHQRAVGSENLIDGRPPAPQRPPESA